MNKKIILFLIPSSCIVTGSSFYYGLALPVTLIIVINFLIFFMVVYALTKNASKSKNKVGGNSSVATQVRIAASCCALLGLTWIFGILAIGESKLVFQYLFCILNSLQGAFIFYFNILRQPRTIEAWRGFMSGKGCRYNMTTSTSSHSSTQYNKTRSIYKDSTQLSDPVPLPEFRMPPKRISRGDDILYEESGGTQHISNTSPNDGNVDAPDVSVKGDDFQLGTPAASIQFSSFVEC